MRLTKEQQQQRSGQRSGGFLGGRRPGIWPPGSVCCTYERVCEVVYTITTKCMHHAERADSGTADETLTYTERKFFKKYSLLKYLNN